MTFTNIQNTEHPEGVMAQQHNQTIMITAGQAQGQQPSQTPPIQQVNVLFFLFYKSFLMSKSASRGDASHRNEQSYGSPLLHVCFKIQF